MYYYICCQTIAIGHEIFNIVIKCYFNKFVLIAEVNPADFERKFVSKVSSLYQFFWLN